MQRDACTSVGCWYLITFTSYGQILVTSYVSETHCFEMTNSLRSNGWEMWNMLLRISRSLKRSASKPHVHGVLCYQDANSKDLLKAVSSFLAFVPPNPVALSLSFCTNSSTFLMSVVTKLFTVFEVAWLFFLCSSLQTLPPLFKGNQGHRSGGFL